MPNFQCVATMNGVPEDLPEPLADRFPVKLHIDEVHKEALNSLQPRLKAIYLDTDQANTSVRRWIELQKLMDSGIKTEVAVDVLFQEEDEQFAVLNALGIQNDSSATTNDDE